jgi:putative oxidoreductase
MAISSDETMVLVTAGRLLLGGLFIIGGIGHLFAPSTIAGKMRARGVPFPMLGLIAGTAFEIVAGALLMFGLFVPLAAVGLILFTIAGSVMMMNFWDMTGEKRVSAIDGWQSNLGVIGGLLILTALALGKTAYCCTFPF